MEERDCDDGGWSWKKDELELRQAELDECNTDLRGIEKNEEEELYDWRVLR